jgi:hypothetical protein
MKIEKGQKLYTANAKTNKVDTWYYSQIFVVNGKQFIELVNKSGNKTVTVPENCIFFTKEDALQALEL